MIRQCLWSLLTALVLCLPVAAETIPQAQRDLFLRFAADVSRDDPEVMQHAKSLAQTPPTTLEGIGFYGLTDAPAAERTLRGIISVLTDQGHLITNEDKYIYELSDTLINADVADPGDEADLLNLTAFFDGVDWDSGETPDWTAFKLFYPRHTAAIERAVAQKGLVLLSVRVPLGDTLYFWAAPRDLAVRWRGKALYAGVNTQKYAQSPFVTFTVTRPDWQSYWEFMTYALDIPQEHRDMP